MSITVDEIASFCKKTGIIYPSSEIYGGLAGFYDFGPNGVEIKNNIKRLWWKTFVQANPNVLGLDGTIITHPKVWEASGHIEGFVDPLVDCEKCKKRWRADHMVEDELKIPTDGLGLETLTELIRKNKIRCPGCKGKLSDSRVFNLMFKTFVGPVEDEKSKAYLRPETAQAIFADYKAIIDSMRVKMPFGIAQIGKAFRNEISPRNFLFRLREFEQMEMEFFVNPKKKNECDLGELGKLKVNIYDREMQVKKEKHKEMTIEHCVREKTMKNKWQAYWIAVSYKWFLELGINQKKLRLRQHLKEELSHYAEDTWDLEYNYPFGWKEIMGNANRGQFDLSQHQKFSGKNLEYYDEEEGERYIPYVASEPSLGVERAVLTFIIDAYTQEKERTVLRLHAKIAPIQVGVFPLVRKDGLNIKAKDIFNNLKNEFRCFYDETGSIGRRYRRQDEIGTPYCITIDNQTMQDDTVTIRDRDSMKQWRLKIDELKEAIKKLF